MDDSGNGRYSGRHTHDDRQLSGTKDDGSRPRNAPVTVLLALAFWGLLWGITGMVLAVPIVATIKIVLARFGTTPSDCRFTGGSFAGHSRDRGDRAG